MRYTYTVEFCVTGSGYRHVSVTRSAREAIAQARLAYAALYVAIGRGNPENAGGNSPKILEEIRRPECTRVTVEPHNRSFFVAINKRK